VDVSFHPAAADEFRTLRVGERKAMQAAVEKLEAYGDLLGFPTAATSVPTGFESFVHARAEARGGASIGAWESRS
jgi:hypothetical protein